MNNVMMTRRALMASLATAPWAQQDPGSITGRIVDPSKAVIGGANMTITTRVPV